ncbi:MAG: lipid-binding SYLF domain-containing protein [Pyrinomonadaceae bacterium]
MKLSALMILSAVLFGAVFFHADASAQKRSDLEKATDRAQSAAEVIREVMRIREKSIPEDIMEKAEAVIVFPGVLKGAFIFGGQGGKGVVVRRLKDGWSAPAFLKMGGGSFGAQIGGEKIDYVMIVRNESGLKGILEDKFEIGGEASVAAGPVGRTTAASTNTTLDAGILTYSRSQGAFIGISLKGAVISQDDDLNRALYKKSAKTLLLKLPTLWDEAPESLQVFPKTVAEYAK